MKKLFIIALVVSAAFTANAQYKFVTHDMGVGPGHPPFPFYWKPYIWWNDTTVTALGSWNQDTVRNLQIQFEWVIKDDLETHRRLDSLILAMKKP
jgi:hypothetical protein